MSLRFTIYQGQPILVANFYDDVILDDFREWALRLPYYTRMFDTIQVYHILDISRAVIDESELKTQFEQERGTWGLTDFKTAGGKRLKGWIVGDTPPTQRIFRLIGRPELGGVYLPVLTNLEDALYSIHMEISQNSANAAI